MRCQGITQKGKNCANPAVTGFEYCAWHVKCCGLKRNGDPCGSRAVKELGYLYCSGAHEIHKPGCPFHDKPKGCLPKWTDNTRECDPSSTTTDPKEFRVENLRSRKAKMVWDFREHKDAYTGWWKDEYENTSLELDHVIELHVVRDAYDKIKPCGTQFRARKEDLKDDLKRLLNETENLNFTRSDINQLKFRGVKKFQLDYQQQTIDNENGLAGYLLNARYESRCIGKSARLSRSITRQIQVEIVRSYDAIEKELRYEDALHETMITLLHDNVVAMKLF